MKNYSDLQDTKLKLDIELETIGNPDFTLSVITNFTDTVAPNDQTYYLDSLTPFSIVIELRNKVYTTEYETAVNIKQIAVDNISVIPEYTHYAEYNNDHGFITPTNYVGFNGKWTLTFDRPFYQWLHGAKNQGWLIG